MPCTQPWLKRFPDGERGLPCGVCDSCKLEFSRQWAVRIMLEARMHDRNSFVTLTYDRAHLPENGSLDRTAFPKFVRALRKRRGGGIRYYHCGEYGRRFSRPHYHAVLFGEDFADTRVPLASRGAPMWVSSELCELWPFGFSSIGSVTMASASYVAQYVVKKVRGSRAAAHYGYREPEYATMSRRPGIGASWFARYARDVYPSDELIVEGKGMAPPRYFDQLLERSDPELWREVYYDRKAAPIRKGAERTAERLEVREVVTRQRLSTYQRRFES